MYSVSQYLTRLRLAKRAPNTLLEYHNAFKSFAAFLNVPIDDLHLHLDPDNLVNYAASRIGKSERSMKVRLGILLRFYTLNGVAIPELDANVLKPRVIEEPGDKPLELATLQKMMDMTDVRGKAVLSFLISTGCRAGECCKIELANVKGDTITIPNRIAKGGRGGMVYLNAEAREYLDAWLKIRDKTLAYGRTKAFARNVPEDDPRLFGWSYSTMRQWFMRLYDLTDGERGKYWSKITIHSCRKYFRTNVVKTLGLDLTEKLMRHQGYLTSSYVRISDEEARRQFHAGESALYITRKDDRTTTAEIKILKQERDEARRNEERIMEWAKDYIDKLMKKES